MIKTIPTPPGLYPLEIAYHPLFSVICSVGGAPFYGSIDITYTPQSVCLEFESFESWLKSLALQEYTIESLARLVFDELVAVLGDISLSVSVHARTTVHAPVSATIKQEV